MKKVNITDGISAEFDESTAYAEILISDSIPEPTTDINGVTYYYNERYYASCIADFIEQNDIKNIKIIGGGENLKVISNLFVFCDINELDSFQF